MDHASEITGLDLFTIPFRSAQASMAAPASSQGAAPSVPISNKSESRSRPMAPQTTPPVQQPKAPEPIEQSPDIPGKSVPEQTKDAEPAREQKPSAKIPEPEQKQSSEDRPEPSKKELVMDMSDHAVPAGKPLEASEDAKRKAHEEAEAKRKAEWEARQREKKEKEEAALQKLQAMTDADAVAASTECVRVAIERITRRNMKECVAGHIQELCQKEPEFARCIMHPRKSLANCFKYINRRAKEYLTKEMEENGIEANGIYGGDVPDATCYKWAEDYFRDQDAPEDKEKEDKFVPRPYRPYVGGSVKKKTTKKSTAQKGRKKKSETDDSFKQMSLEGIS